MKNWWRHWEIYIWYKEGEAYKMCTNSSCDTLNSINMKFKVSYRRAFFYLPPWLRWNVATFSSTSMLSLTGFCRLSSGKEEYVYSQGRSWGFTFCTAKLLVRVCSALRLANSSSVGGEHIPPDVEMLRLFCNQIRINFMA